MLGIMVACKLWACKWRGKRILLLCDNSTTVRVLNSGKTKNLYLQKCLREIKYVASDYEFEVKAQHIQGENNRIPDYLSRWDTDVKYQDMFRAATGQMHLKRRELSL